MEETSTEMDNLAGELDELVDDTSVHNLGRIRKRKDYLPLRRTKCPIPEPVRSSLTPPRTKQECMRFFLLRLPILSWLWSYKPRYLVGDVIAGITVSVMHIPQGLAYALLASLPPVYGLYTSFVPPIIYSVFGTSRHLSVGTFAVVSLMIGQAVDRLVMDNNIPCVEGSGLSGNGSSAMAVCLSFKVGVAVTITFLSGLTLTIMSIFQLGFVSVFLSSALVSGYTTGAAVHVATSQVRHMLGIPQVNVTAPPGPFNSPKVWILLVDNIVQGNVNVATIIISLVSCIFLIVIRNVNLCLTKTKLYKKLPIPIPAQLILVVVATLLSYLFEFKSRWGVSIVDTIERGPPPSTTPVAEHISSVITDAITVAIVTFAVGVSLSKVFAKRNKYELSSNQEMFAYGIVNVVGSFFSCFGPSGSLSRSLIQENVGGKTQLVGIISSIILFTVLMGIAPLFEPLPKTILASVVIIALYGMFKQVTHLLKYWKTSKFDMLVWIVIFFSTVLLGVDYGLLVGTIFSVALVIFRILLPMASSLGEFHADSDMEYQETGKVVPIPGIVIFSFFSPLCYLNAGVFRSKLVIKAKVDPSKNEKGEGTGCWKAAYLKMKKTFGKKKITHDNEDFSEVDVDNSSVNSATEHPVEVMVGESNSTVPSHCELDSVSQHTSVAIPNGADGSEESLHTIIIDCSALSFVDSVGAEALQQIIADYEEIKVQVLLAAAPRHVVAMLKRNGFFKTFGDDWLFPSIKSAVDFAKAGERLDRVKLEQRELLFARTAS